MRRVSLATLAALLLTASVALVAQAGSSASTLPAPVPVPTPTAPAEGGSAVAPSAGQSPTPDETAADEAATEGLVTATLGLDIATASFYELADWARQLGLDESGSVEELRARLYQHYGIESAERKAAEGRRVQILSAARAEYSDAGDSGGLISLSGAVGLVITEANGETHRLSARRIIYDRERNAVSARGEVQYHRSGKGQDEEFSGESLVADLDDWSGVFLDGSMRRAGAELGSGERGLSFSAETLLKRSADVLVFENGTVSSCDAEDPHYSLRAGRMWLLGGNDWAMSNAVLSVGEVPILWLPFFYYPAEELAFHPVLGYRSREGRYLQTTTYLLGRKPAPEKPTGILRFAPQTGPTELRGLFLRRVAGEEPTETRSLKVLGDLYSGLGAFAGLDGALGALGPFSRLSFTTGIAVSRSLFSMGSYHSPYAAAGAWESVWNGSRFLGLELPIRYALDASAELKKGNLAVNLALPFYSDPFFEQDFRNRSEEMDWLGLSEADATSTGPSKRSSFSQRIGATYSPDVSSLAPWLSSFRISKLDASLTWQSKTDSVFVAANPLTYGVDPAREFFYPEVLRPIDLSAELRGTLFRFPAGSGKPQAAGASPGTASGDSVSTAEPALREPWASKQKPERPESGLSGELPFRTPPQAPSLGAAAKTGGGSSSQPLELSADWSLTPTLFWEDRYLSDEWSSAADIDGSRLYRLLSYRATASLSGTARLYGERLGASLGLSYTDQDQFREIPASLPESRKTTYTLADAQYESRKLGASLKLSSKPFASGSALALTSLSYSLDSVLFRHAYSGLDGSTPVFSDSLFRWDSDSVTAHSLGLTLGIPAAGRTQSLGFTMTLPPLTEAYTARLDLGAALRGYSSSLALQSRLSRPASTGLLRFDPISANFQVQTPFTLSLSDVLIYDPEDAQFDSNLASLSWRDFSASLQARRATAYAFDKDEGGWTSAGNESFRLTEFMAAYKLDRPAAELGWARFGYSASASFNQSLLRFTDSTLSLAVALNLSLGKGFTLSLSNLSQNRSVWRYWPELFPAAAAALGDLDAYRRPLLADLIDSLSFWDTEARYRGLFKLKSLSLKLSQDLHDWDIAFSVSLVPYLDTSLTPKRYILDPSVSFSVAWREIPEMKSDIKYTRTGWNF